MIIEPDETSVVRPSNPNTIHVELSQPNCPYCHKKLSIDIKVSDNIDKSYNMDFKIMKETNDY